MSCGLGWYYLDDHLRFPFKARCVTERMTSPLWVDDVVEVHGMPPEEVYEHEMLAIVGNQTHPASGAIT
jgi:Calcium binding